MLLNNSLAIIKCFLYMPEGHRLFRQISKPPNFKSSYQSTPVIAILFLNPTNYVMYTGFSNNLIEIMSFLNILI